MKPLRSKTIPDHVFAAEYEDFLRMGLDMNEMARAFHMSMDTLEHRILRYRGGRRG